MAERRAPVRLERTLSDQVFRLLRDWILDGTLEPGQNIRIRETAAMVGTSEMPVREAVRRLEECGLLVRRPHRGAVVATLSMKELRDFYGVRRILEAEAARLGAERIKASGIAAMQRSWQDLLEAQRQELFLDALRLDAEFLTTLYRAADNQALLHLIQSLWDRVQPYRVLWTATAKERDGVDAWRYNAEILEAAKARDGAWAARVTMASLESAQAVLEGLIARNP